MAAKRKPRKPVLPPKDVEPVDLFLKLQERPRPSEVVEFPRKDPDGKPVARVRIQVLTMKERQQALLKAKKWCTDQGLTVEDFDVGIIQEGVYGNAVAREILALACVSEKDHAGPNDKCPIYTKHFASGAHVDEVLTGDELAVLFSQYSIVQNKFGPCAGGEIQTEAELSAWIRRLGMGGSAIPFASMNSSQSVELLAMLAARAFILSHILESQCENLPPTLVSQLRTWEIGTGYWSEPLETGSDETAESTTADDLEPGPDALLSPDDEPVTLEHAKTLARRFTQG